MWKNTGNAHKVKKITLCAAYLMRGVFPSVLQRYSHKLEITHLKSEGRQAQVWVNAALHFILLSFSLYLL